MISGLLLSHCSAIWSQQPLSSWLRLVYHQQAHIPPSEGKDRSFYLKSWPTVVHILSTYVPLPSFWQDLILLEGYLSVPPTAQRSMAPSPVPRTYPHWSKPSTAILHSPVRMGSHMGLCLWPKRSRKNPQGSPRDDFVKDPQDSDKQGRDTPLIHWPVSDLPIVPGIAMVTLTP